MKLRRAPAAALATLAVLTACGTDDNSGLPGAVDFSARTLRCAPGGGTLLASGSSAQANAMEVWVNTYQANCDGSQINYKPSGSGAGIQEFLQGTTAFAGSDSLLTGSEVAESRSVCDQGGRQGDQQGEQQGDQQGEAIHLPMVAGPIAIGYNLPGVDHLVLDAATAARVFDSKITRWNDPAIAGLNPGARLPDLPITPFHRSDGSGTTDNFTAYLHASAPGAWPHEPDKNWRGHGGQAAEGSSGLVGQVQQNEGAISYFELSYAHQNDITTARVDTGARRPVTASVANSSNAVAQARVTGRGGDLALELDYATREAGAYPIVLVTYEILCDHGNNPGTLPLTKAFLRYTASPEGQDQLARIDYAPMPGDIIRQVRQTIRGLR